MQRFSNFIFIIFFNAIYSWNLNSLVKLGLFRYVASNALVAELVDASAYQAEVLSQGNCGFESHRAHHGYQGQRDE